MSDDDDDFDEDFFATIDKVVEQHQATKAQTQRSSQALSPIQQPAPANGPPNGGIPPPPHNAAAPPQFPNAQQHNADPPAGLPVGRISHAAAQLRVGSHEEGTGIHPSAQQNGAPPTGSRPMAPQPGLDVATLQQRAEVAEGTNRVLRSNLEQLERDRHGLRQRVAQLEGRGGGGNQAATVGEMQKQLAHLKEQLMFKEQEVDEMKRRQATRTETAPIAAADNREGTGAQQGIGEANTSRPGTAKSHASRQTAPVQQQQPQQQQQQQSERTKRRADGSAAQVPQAPPQQQQPLVTSLEPRLPLSLSMVHLGEGGQPAAVARLWASCPEAMSVILAAARSSGPLASLSAGHAPLSFAPLAGRNYSHSSGSGVRVQDNEIASSAAAFTDSLPRVSSGLQDAAALLHPLCCLVSRAAILASEESQQDTSPQGAGQRRYNNNREDTGPLAAAALVVMAHLVQEDTSCKKAALASIGCTLAALQASEGPPRAPSNRVVFTEQHLPANNNLYLDTAMAGGAGPDLSSDLAKFSFAVGSGEGGQGANINGTNNNSATGVLAVLIQATLAFRSLNSTDAVAGALQLALALATATRSGAGRIALLPLATSGALSIFFNRGPSLRLQTLHLLYLLLEDSAIAAAVSADVILAASARSPATATAAAGGANGNSAQRQRRRSDSTTPVTRGASSKRAAVDADGDMAMQGEEKSVRWAGGVLDHILTSLVLQEPTNSSITPNATAAGAGASGDIVHLGGDDGEVARAALAVLALLLEQQSDACLRYLIDRETVLLSQGTRPSSAGAGGGGGGGGGGGSGSNNGTNTAEGSSNSSSFPISASLPVKLVLLAEEAVKDNGEGASLVPLSAAGWPKGQWPAVAAPQATWQLRLRIAQETLTLLRDLMLSPTIGIVATDELITSSGVQQRVLTGLGRLSRVEAPTEPTEGGQLLSGVPIAAWAYAIGTSTAAASMGPPEGAATRGGMPCCSARDVVYLARGTKHRMMHRMSA